MELIRERFSQILFLVIAMASVGQLANTIYVPAMAMMAASIHVVPEKIQILMAAYLIPYGLSQFVYGPLSDQYGRRPVVLCGLAIFVVGALICSIASSLNTLMLGSIIQGLGVGVAGVMARTVMRDCYSDHKLHRANTWVAIALIFAPLLAPIIGGLLVTWFSWRANFIFLLFFAGLVLAVEYYLFPETNLFIKPQYRQRGRLKKAYATVLTTPGFLGYCLCLVLAFSGVAIFEASSGVLFTQVLHFKPAMISVLFILPVPGYLLGSYASGFLANKVSLYELMFISVLVIAVACLLLSIFAFLLIINLAVILGPITLYFFGAGLLFPAATTGAINPCGQHAGTAGAVLGGLQNLGAGLMTWGFSQIHQTTVRPLALALDTMVVLLAFMVMALIRPAR